MKKVNYLFFKVLFASLLFLLVGSGHLSAQNQESGSSINKFKLQEKGRFFVTWGYNRSWYEKSDIHFTGQGHDFILYDVKATDRPTKLSTEYISLSNWSVPQFNFRVGYFLSDKYSVSIGWDHMKYVATDYQVLKMSGHLDPTQVQDALMKTNMENMNALYAPNGLYNNTQVIMEPNNFLRYEHTDGFNFATVDLERYDKLWQYSKYDKLGVSLVSGLGAGAIVPRTDAHLFGSGANHYWNVAGWGIDAKVALQISLTKHFYFESNLKAGYVKMLNVHTTNYYNTDKAKQNVTFYENNWLIGYRF